MRIQSIVATLAFASVTSVAQAVPNTTTSSQTDGSDNLQHTYTPSSTDLLNGLSPSAQAGNFLQEGTGGPGVLTNGTFPPVLRPLNFTDFATGGNTGGTSLTYTLPTASDIAKIDIYGGWQDGGRDQHSYSILYATAANPGIFLPLVTVDFNPADPNQHPQATQVSITDTTGTLAGNVRALRFDFGATENGYSGYAEIDAFVVPEPGSAVMVVAGLGILGAVRRWRV